MSAYGRNTPQQNLLQELDEIDNGLNSQQLQELITEVNRLRLQVNAQARQNEEMEELKKEVVTLRTASNIINTPIPSRNTMKLNPPPKYDGATGQLQAHLTQIRAYQRYNSMENWPEDKKVVHASSYLEGRALAWFEPYLTDYMNHKTPEEMKPETREMFNNYENYENALKSLFQDPDEERQAERQLANCQQRSSAAAYATEFRRISARIKATDQTKIFMFYRGLKNEVKDELSKIIDQPSEFLQYVELAIKIDNRLYERRLEKKGSTSGQFQRNNTYKPNTGKKYNKPSTQWGQHAGPMELDATQRKDKKDIECFNCGKKGHFKRECRGKKKDQNWKSVPEGPRQANAASQDNTKVAPENTKQANVASRTNKKPPRSSQQRELAEQYCICNSAVYDQCQVHPEKDLDDGRILFGIDLEDAPRTKRTKEEIHNSLHCSKCYSPVCKAHEAEKARWAPVPTGNTREFKLKPGETAQQRLSQLVQRELDEAVATRNHASLSWTACYNDNCPTHRSDKEGANWFPKGVTQQRTLAVGKREELPRDPRKELAGEIPQDLPAPLAKQEDPRAYLGKAPLLAPSTNITRIAIKGRAFEQVFGRRRHTTSLPEDAGRTNPQHHRHTTISWASCIYDGCRYHLREKVACDWFPRRYHHQPVKHTFGKGDLKLWKMIQRDLEEGVAIFELDPSIPLPCYRQPHRWQVCVRADCKVHSEQKIEEWHRLQRQGQILSPMKPTTQENNIQRLMEDLQKSQNITRRNIESIDKVLGKDRQPKN